MAAPRSLVVLRHAKSAWPEDTPDAHRPLADRGRRDAPAAGRWLRTHLDRIDLVVCSPAVRARQTWELVSGQLKTPPAVREDERVYEASAETLLAVTRDLPGDAHTVVLVGHNPGLEDLVALLTGDRQQVKTSTIAVLAGSGAWADAGPGWARLRRLATPRG
ncbi:SixA phosphatase family protein [Gandjariella thermophila]|nr:histidine phosphatase family protein [Gandjariella thermophila]